MNKARICSHCTQGDRHLMSNKMEVTKGSKGRSPGVEVHQVDKGGKWERTDKSRKTNMSADRRKALMWGTARRRRAQTNSQSCASTTGLAGPQSTQSSLSANVHLFGQQLSCSVDVKNM